MVKEGWELLCLACCCDGQLSSKFEHQMKCCSCRLLLAPLTPIWQPLPLPGTLYVPLLSVIS